MYPAVEVDGLRLLVRQPAPLRYLEHRYPSRARYYALSFAQPGDHRAGAVFPRLPVVVGVRVTDVMVILRTVRARLLLVLGVERIIPAFVVYEPPVYPGHVESAVPVVQPVDIGAVLNALEERSEARVDPVVGAVDIQVVVAEARLACAETEEHVPVTQTPETRVGYVAELRGGGNVAGETV